MSTRSLVIWVALVAGAELAVRGHLADHGWACHGGALLFAGALWFVSSRPVVRGAALLLVVVAGIDAVLAAREIPAAPSRPVAKSNAPVDPHAPPSTPETPGGGFRILAFGASPSQDGRVDWGEALETHLARRFACRNPIQVVGGALTDRPLGGGVRALGGALEHSAPHLVLIAAHASILDHVLKESPSLVFPHAEPLGPRASVLGAWIENEVRGATRRGRWRKALADAPEADPNTSAVAASYRVMVTSARRHGAEVSLLVPPLAPGPETPEAMLRAGERTQPDLRSRVLAQRAHASLVRAVAGSYALRAVTTDAREGWEDRVADALRETLERPEAGCHERGPPGDQPASASSETGGGNLARIPVT